MLRVRLVGIFCDGARGHFIGEGRVAAAIAGSELGGGARAQPIDAGADHSVGKRHALGGADDRRNQAHDVAPVCGGSGKNMLVRA